MPRQRQVPQAADVINGDRKTIQDIFAPSRRLKVPTYQRSFAWTTAETDDLWDDLQPLLEGQVNSYFIGPMVFVDKGENVYEVVDGQQRLAAVSLLFAAIRDGLREAGRVDDAAQVAMLLKRRRSLTTGETAHILTLNDTDNEAFLQIMAGERSAADLARGARTRSEPESVRLLTAAYASYYERLRAETDGFTNWQQLGRYFESLAAGVAVIEITTASDEAAYTFFETLNARGVDLTLSDLVKNYLFSKAGARLSEVQRLWTEAVATVGQGTMTRFIRHEWTSRKGKIRETALYRRLKTDIPDAAKAVAYAKGLREAGEVYAALSNPTSPVWRGFTPRAKELLRQIGAIQAVQCFPALLSARLERKPRDFQQIAEWLVALSVRYSVIGGKGTGNLETVLAGAAPLCREKGRPPSDVRKALLAIYPDDEEFRGAFASKRLTDPPTARLVLAAIERHVAGTEKVADPDLTLEHVLPKKPGTGWPQTLRGTPRHAELLHRIGNLTLLTADDNSRLPGGFEDKKRLYARSKLEITKRLAAFRQWDARSIDERQSELADAAVEIWRL